MKRQNPLAAPSRLLSMMALLAYLTVAAPVGVHAQSAAAGEEAVAVTSGPQALLVSTGVAKGTYAAMFRDMHRVCGPELRGGLSAMPATGSLESLERLMDNEAHLAFVQADALHVRDKAMRLDRIKTLLVLQPEELHVITLRAASPMSALQGLLGRGTPIRSLDQLQGKRVATWGGGAITARLLQVQGEIALRMVDVPGPEQAMAALVARDVDAVLAVGGAPLAWVRQLDARFTLLGMSDALVNKLARVYRPAKISYSNLADQPVATIATEAMLVTQDYRSPQLREPVLRLRQCLKQRLATLQESTGMHAGWRSVDPDARGHWAWFGDGRPAHQAAGLAVVR